MHNLSISASAGAGKTYQLSNRYINLLAQGIPPERIVALTFSRKAAGEIADRIITRLARSAGSADALLELNRGMDEPLSSSDCLNLLRTLCMRLPLLRISTIDSFMAQTVRLFTYELGIQGTFEVIDGLNLFKARQKALQEVLSHRSSASDRKQFCEHFRQVTFGTEERSICSTLNTYISEHHKLLLAAPSSALWGHAPTIWPTLQPWLAFPPASPEQRTAAIHTVLDYVAQHAPALNRSLAKDLEFMDRFDGTTTPKFSKIGESLVQRRDQLGAPPFDLKYSKKDYSFPAEICAALNLLTTHMLQTSLLSRLHRTQGLFQILNAYEQAYNRKVRRAGQLSFADITQVLAAAAPALSLDGGPDLLYIAYRLDGRYEHWMFDEFQDTSNTQWDVFRNLMDEVLHTPEADRTFFYVGDVKQAIYGWRGGDARLFNRVYNQYKNLPPPATLDKMDLACSWRSSPAVIATVNRIFDNLASDRIPEAVSARWQAIWKPHECASKNAGMPGFCSLCELPREKDTDPEEARFSKTAEIITRLQTRPGLSIAVLVRNRKAGHDLVRFLRSEHIAVAWEGEMQLADNTVVAALLSLLRLSEHPGDSFAWQHIQMTPLKNTLTDCKTPGHLAHQLRKTIHTFGFEHTLTRWVSRCRTTGCTFSDFTELRLRQLKQAALEFDRTGTPNVLDFIDYIQSQTVTEAPTSGAVRVMTIHKSKGLEYDAVLLPQLEGRHSLDACGKVDLSIHFSNSDLQPPEAEWVLYLPPKDISEADPVLAAHRQQLTESNAYETLCTLYVAITRAKHAAYMITTAPSEKSTAYYTSTLLSDQLRSDSDSGEILYSCGDPEWYTRLQTAVPALQPLTAIDLPAPQPIPNCAPSPRLLRELPSDNEHNTIPAEKIFASYGLQAADFGTALHALFEQIEWLDQTDLDAVIHTWMQHSPLPKSRQADIIREFRAATNSPAVRAALSRPAHLANVWREHPFELAADGIWLSGCIDRLTVCYDADGHPTRAAVIDYKSSRYASDSEAPALAEHYRPQLEQYRKAAARILSLPPECITAAILFTQSGLVCPL